MRKHSIVALTLIFALALVTAAMAGDDPFLGTWKLNLAKSKYSDPAPKSQTIKIAAQDGGIKFQSDGIDDQGKPSHWGFSAKFDGKDYPVTGEPSMATIASKKTSSSTWDWVTKTGGKEEASGRNVLSKDGKTMTVTRKGKNAKGQEVTNIDVLEKQ